MDFKASQRPARKPPPGDKPHALKIRALLDDNPEYYTNGFACALHEYLRETSEAFEWWRHNRIYPDLYHIDAENDLVVAIEVEASNPVKGNRLVSYAYFWSQLDCECVDLRLVIHDVRGGQFDIDLMEQYYQTCLGAAVEAEG